MIRIVQHAWSRVSAGIAARNRGFRRGDGGQVLPFFAVIALVIVMLCGTVTDYGQTLRKSVRAQTAADAAALAAATWVSRGGNFAQILNGIHYDLNYTLAQIIALTANIAMIVVVILQVLACVPYIGTVCNVLKQIVVEVENVIITIAAGIHSVYAPILNVIQKAMVHAVPWIAILHANMTARNNGATALDEMLLDIIRNAYGRNTPALDILDKIASVKNDFFPGIYTWTLSPSLKMWSNHRITKAFQYNYEEWSGKESFETYLGIWNSLPYNWRHVNPYALGITQPFTATATYWSGQKDKLTWNDAWVLQGNKETQITMTRWSFLPPRIDTGGDESDDSEQEEDESDTTQNSTEMPDFVKKILDGTGLGGVIDDLNTMMDELSVTIMESVIGDLAHFFIALKNALMECRKDSKGARSALRPDELIRVLPEDIMKFTYVVAVKSEMGSFLKMFGPTIGEEKEGFNVPMTLAFATARVRGHPLHPGGLLKLMSVPGVGDEYEVIRMICVPFWISALPEQTRYRIFNPSFATYTGTWRPQLVPVTFERYRKPWKSGRPRRTKIMPGKMFGFNH